MPQCYLMGVKSAPSVEGKKTTALFVTVQNTPVSAEVKTAPVFLDSKKDKGLCISGHCE